MFKYGLKFKWYRYSQKLFKILINVSFGFQIILTLMVGSCLALPQRRIPSDQGDYQPANQDQFQPPAAPQYQDQKRESTTFIPIIRFDKEQGEDGSYKASLVYLYE